MTTRPLQTVDSIRQLIGDTADDPYLTDEEIQGYITASPPKRPYYACYLALTSLANRFSIHIGQVSALGYAGDGTVVARLLREQARQYLYVEPSPLTSRDEVLSEVVTFLVSISDEDDTTLGITPVQTIGRIDSPVQAAYFTPALPLGTQTFRFILGQSGYEITHLLMEGTDLTALLVREGYVWTWKADASLPSASPLRRGILTVARETE